METQRSIDAEKESKRKKLEEMRSKAKKAYHHNDITRPPFSYEGRSLYEEECMYDEAREDEIFQMEKEVFEAAEKMKAPNDPRLQKAYDALKSAERALDSSVVIIQNQIHRKIRKTIGRNIPLQEANISANERSRQNLMEVKNRYLQTLKCYCDIAKRVHLSTGANEDANKMEELFQKVDTVYIAHTTYTTIRSYIHHEVNDPEILREDESLTVQHLYTTAVHTMNRYLKRIKSATDPVKKREWWTKMKQDLATMLLHDWKEDLKRISPEDMFATLFRLTGPETQLQSLFRDEGLPNEDYEDHYFFMNHFEAINSGVEKLTKLEKTPELATLSKEELKEKRLEHEIKMLDCPRALANKCRDRINNLATLRYMRGNKSRKEGPADAQIRKIQDSHHLFGIGATLNAQTAHDPEEKVMMLEELQLLCRIALREIKRLQEKDGQPLGQDLVVNLTNAQKDDLNTEEAYYYSEQTRITAELLAKVA